MLAGLAQALRPLFPRTRMQYVLFNYAAFVLGFSYFVYYASPPSSAAELAVTSSVLRYIGLTSPAWPLMVTGAIALAISYTERWLFCGYLLMILVCVPWIVFLVGSAIALWTGPMPDVGDKSFGTALVFGLVCQGLMSEAWRHRQDLERMLPQPLIQEP